MRKILIRVNSCNSLLLFFFLIFTYSFAGAQSRFFYTSELLQPVIENAPEVNSRSVVLIDAVTGALLYEKNIHDEIPPASLTKLMTMHVVMKEIEAGRASYDELIPVTEQSWALRQPRGSSLMFLEPGQNVSLREIMLGLAVSSGNDAAVALALRFAPSVREFAHLMTREAQNMGLYHTRFFEPSGISAYNMTTADEFAWFCRQYIYTHPNSLKDFHAVPEFSYPLAHNVARRHQNNPRTITQFNRNLLLDNVLGVDGLKTGYIEESGYNIALTAERDGTRFISVSLGAESTPERTTDGRNLLEWAFENFKTVRPVIGRLEAPRLWKGKLNNIEITPAYSVNFTSLASRVNNISYTCYFPAPIIAPLTAGTIVGDLILYDNHGELHRVPLVTEKAYDKGNIFKRIWHSIRLLFIK